jgi:hypothetical protein
MAMEVQSQLDYIFKGMEVYDWNGDHVGTVEYVYFGADTSADEMFDIDTLKSELSEAMGGIKGFPTPVYSRLHRYGFIRVKRGFLRPDMFIVPQQIANVEDDRVYLSVETHALLKG